MPISQLEQLVRFAIYGLIMLATVLLSLGEPSGLIPLATLAVIVVSHFVTDTTRRFRLQQRMADGVALGIMVLSAILAIRGDRQDLLVIVANLQSYLQYVLFFQQKSPRVYWQLALLSLGQMAIAATLVPGPTFGFALLGYVLLGIIAFALMLLLRESTRLTSAPPARQVVPAAGDLEFAGSAAPVPPRDLLIKLLAPAGLITVLTFVISAVLFLVLPRWSVESLESMTTEPLRTVGFSKTVTLGELGSIVNNPDTVMRVELFRGRSDRTLKLEGEPLFRGSVVSRYEGRTWSQPFQLHTEPLRAEAGSTITRQRIQIEPLDVNEVFCIAPTVAIDRPDSKLQIDVGTNQVIRRDEDRSAAMEFDIGTTGIVGNRQRDILPCTRPPRHVHRGMLLQPFRYSTTENSFPALKALADQILSQQNISAETNPYDAARALSDYFHLSGQFFYSLEPQQRDPERDPLEDFVTLHRSGHCEYFAGALVLMLRSQGIPARMVIGFKGGEWNPVGGYYQVQQLHAHAWVEALLAADQVPPGTFAGERLPEAAWLVLDPTEGTQEDSGLARAGMMARIRQSIDYAKVLWINYVASLNAKRQKQGIYEPLAAGLEAGVANITSVEVWQARLQALEESRLGRFWRWYRRHWFSWRGGLVAVGFSLGLVGLFVGVRTTLRMLRNRGWLGDRREAKEPPVMEIYRRLEAALSRTGLVRPPAQTAYEFAIAAGCELAERVEHRGVSHLPRRVVEAFYRVRFGRQALDKQEAEAVEQALDELERVLGVAR